MLRCELDGVENAQNFVEVASRTHWVAQLQLDLLIRTDHKDGTDSSVVYSCSALGCVSGRRGQHVVQFGNLKLRIADHRVVHLMALSFFDINRPFAVTRNRVNAQSYNFGVSLGKFGLEAGHVAEFGGADGREIFWMGKQNCIAISDPLVKADRALGSFSSKVWCNIIDT